MKAIEPAEPTTERAIIRRRRRLSVVWVVPLIAVLVAGYLVYNRAGQAGPRITIRFKDSGGLKPGQSPVKYRGVTVGEVRSLALSEDLQSVEVTARLEKGAAALAKEGATFWIVRPELSVANVSGLSTIISGPYIEALPGDGAAKKSFDGADSAPASLEDEGLKIILVAAHRGSLRVGSPVYYRGIEVGAVQKLRLSDDARRVEVDTLIRQRYAPLVRAESKFWNASGLDLDIGLFKGAQVNIESLQSLVAGGLSFATPDGPKAGEAAQDGAIFALYDEPKKEWLEWAPAIALSPAP
jgi:paraquat-inducible protein B